MTLKVRCRNKYKTEMISIEREEGLCIEGSSEYPKGLYLPLILCAQIGSSCLQSKI